MNKRIKKKTRKRIAAKYEYITICDGSGEKFVNKETLYYPRETKIKKIREESYDDYDPLSQWSHGIVYRVPKNTPLFDLSIEEECGSQKVCKLYTFNWIEKRWDEKEICNTCSEDIQKDLLSRGFIHS